MNSDLPNSWKEDTNRTHIVSLSDTNEKPKKKEKVVIANQIVQNIINKKKKSNEPTASKN